MCENLKENNVNSFWQDRSTKIAYNNPVSLVYFEEDPEMINDRIEYETNLIIPFMDLTPDKTVLDLGAGFGQWSLRFAPLAKSVTAVEFQNNFIEMGKQLSKDNNISNIKFINKVAEEYSSEQKFDRIFFSGILMYMNDDKMAKTLKNSKNMLADDGFILLIEPSSILDKRFVINNKYSKELEHLYSAIYRTGNEFKQMFKFIGMECLLDKDLFPENSPHNKRIESRQRIYIFK